MADPGQSIDRTGGRVAESFSRQRLMAHLGATLRSVRAGEVEIALAFRPELTQQHGFLHAAAVTAIADSACGYAALSVMPEGSSVLSVEFKVNLLAPALGAMFVATGRVVRAGRTIVVTSGEVQAEAEAGGERKPILLMQATMMRVEAIDGRPG